MGGLWSTFLRVFVNRFAGSSGSRVHAALAGPLLGQPSYGWYRPHRHLCLSAARFNELFTASCGSESLPGRTCTSRKQSLERQ